MLPAAFYSRHNVDLIESQGVRCHGLPLQLTMRAISSKHVLQAENHYFLTVATKFSGYWYQWLIFKGAFIGIRIELF